MAYFWFNWACSRSWNEIMMSLSTFISWFFTTYSQNFTTRFAEICISFQEQMWNRLQGFYITLDTRKKKIFGPFPSLLFTFLLTCFPAAHYSILSGCFQGWLGCGRMIWSLKQHSSPIKRVVERRTQWGEIFSELTFPFFITQLLVCQWWSCRRATGRVSVKKTKSVIFPALNCPHYSLIFQGQEIKLFRSFLLKTCHGGSPVVLSLTDRTLRFPSAQ